MKKICANCNVWRRFTKKSPVNKDEYVTFRHGSCGRQKFRYGREWDLDGDSPTDALYYWDSEGYFASFFTGEDFGCVHFKRRRI